jgi:NAD(P)-dependent dehydrogenase (short-subunit alcohol dehydrogenase family)
VQNGGKCGTPQYDFLRLYTEIRCRLLETARGRWKLQHTPLGRFGKPSDLHGAALFLASDMSEYVTGTELDMDGGYLARGVGPEFPST